MPGSTPIPLSVYLLCGYQQPSYRTDGAGWWALSDKIEAWRPDARPVVYCWDTPIGPILKDIDADRREGKAIVLIPYSWGAGHEALFICDGCQAEDIEIDLAMYVDSVLWDPNPIKRFLGAMLPSDEPFPVPANVKRYAWWMQTNRRLADPKPRKPFSLTAPCLLGRPISNPAVGHSDIDNYGPVHQDILGLLQEQYGS
jgi:hypothetical protein